MVDVDARGAKGLLVTGLSVPAVAPRRRSVGPGLGHELDDLLPRSPRTFTDDLAAAVDINEVRGAGDLEGVPHLI